MTKTLWESTTIISKRKNRFNKTRSNENWSLYKTQRKLCTKLSLYKTQRKFCTKLSKKKYGRLFLSFLNPNYAIFWQTIKPQSLEKGNFYNKTIISEKRMHGFWRHITIWGFNKQFIDITNAFDLKQYQVSFLLLQVFLKLLTLLKIIPVLKRFLFARERVSV